MTLNWLQLFLEMEAKWLLAADNSFFRPWRGKLGLIRHFSNKRVETNIYLRSSYCKTIQWISWISLKSRHYDWFHRCLWPQIDVFRVYTFLIFSTNITVVRLTKEGGWLVGWLQSGRWKSSIDDDEFLATLVNNLSSLIFLGMFEHFERLAFNAMVGWMDGWRFALFQGRTRQHQHLNPHSRITMYLNGADGCPTAFTWSQWSKHLLKALLLTHSGELFALYLFRMKRPTREYGQKVLFSYSGYHLESLWLDQSDIVFLYKSPVPQMRSHIHKESFPTSHSQRDLFCLNFPLGAPGRLTFCFLGYKLITKICSDLQIRIRFRPSLAHHSILGI